MSRRYRRKNNSALNFFLMVVLLLLIGVLGYKIYNEKVNPSKIENNNNKVQEKSNKSNAEEKNDNKTNEVNNTNNKSEEKTSENTTKKEVTDKSSKNEKKENKNEQARRGGDVQLELIGEEEVTVSFGSKYKDAGVKATYSDGSDASAEVDIDNAVDTSKKGTYTVTYSSGNVVIIRRVTVE